MMAFMTSTSPALVAMSPFAIFTPTRLLFGGDEQLAPFAGATARLGTKAIVITGGGTVERLGYLAAVTGALTAAGMAVIHQAGVEPNPEAATINRIAARVREEGADVVVALGGGSTMDAAKAVAALAVTDEPDVWPFVLTNPRGGELTAALPLAVVPTTAATGSEVTPFAVISDRRTGGKSFLAAEFLKPQVAWLNPAHTVGLSPTVTRDGAADILSHVFENYLLGGGGSALADRYAEGVVATVLETLPVLLEHPDDVAARGTLVWASTLALNDYQNAGREPSGVVLHFIEHALSGRRPELAHGRGLATLYPAYFRWLLDHGRAEDRFAQLGERIFGLGGDDASQAEGFVERFEAWLADNGLWQSLPDLGFAEADYAPVAEYAVRTYGDGEQLDALGPLPAQEIVAILRATHRQGRPR
jgi:alcohol dehydrogenase YqhD (iron-dependent ADH family)